MLSFYTRASDMLSLDMLEVRFSAGASSDTASFTNLLGTLGSSTLASYPTEGWTLFQFALPSSTTGRIAFHYTVGNGLDAGYIGLDSLAVTAVPEPTSTLLLGLGLCGIVGRVALRRRSPL